MVPMVTSFDLFNQRMQALTDSRGKDHRLPSRDFSAAILITITFNKLAGFTDTGKVKAWRES